MFLSFKQQSNHPYRARKLEIAKRVKQVRRPLEEVLDQQFDSFNDDPVEDLENTVAVTARPRPLLWELGS